MGEEDEKEEEGGDGEGGSGILGQPLVSLRPGHGYKRLAVGVQDLLTWMGTLEDKTGIFQPKFGDILTILYILLFVESQYFFKFTIGGVVGLMLIIIKIKVFFFKELAN